MVWRHGVLFGSCWIAQLCNTQYLVFAKSNSILQKVYGKFMVWIPSPPPEWVVARPCEGGHQLQAATPPPG